MDSSHIYKFPFGGNLAKQHDLGFINIRILFFIVLFLSFFHYSTMGRAQESSSCEEKKFDANGYLISKTDAECRTTKYVRDKKGRETVMTEAFGTANERSTTTTWSDDRDLVLSIGAPGLTTSFTYNADGQVITRTETDTTTHSVPYATNGQKRVWNYTYNANNKLLTVDGPLPGDSDKVTFRYDANFHIQSFTNEVGHVSTFIAVNDFGWPTQMKEASGLIKELKYDDGGNLVSVVDDPNGVAAKTTISYGSFGYVSEVVLPNGTSIKLKYDKNRRLVEIAGSDQKIAYTYDNNGNTTSEVYSNGSSAIYFNRQRIFDKSNKLIQAIRAGSAKWIYGYDKVGNQISLTDPNGNATASTYDELNRLIRFADERTSATTWSYGQTDDAVSTTDTHSVTTSYVRNGWGEVIQEQSRAMTSELSFTSVISVA